MAWVFNNLENISFSLLRKLVRRRKFFFFSFFSNRNASTSFSRVVYIAPQRSKITVTTDEVKFRTNSHEESWLNAPDKRQSYRLFQRRFNTLCGVTSFQRRIKSIDETSEKLLYASTFTEILFVPTSTFVRSTRVHLAFRQFPLSLQRDFKVIL